MPAFCTFAHGLRPIILRAGEQLFLRNETFWAKRTFTEMVRVLNVAEKNDAAKNISAIMSGGRVRRREGRSRFNKIYEFEYTLFNQQCQMVMTSVSGHLLNIEFTGSYKKWQLCNPVQLFEAPIKTECLPEYQPIKMTLEHEVRNCQYLIIWTDGDREGENIGFEIIEVCKKIRPNITVLRARFSEITQQAIFRACTNLVQPDARMNDAVNVRKELDLRIGASFTRFQTMRLQKVFPAILAKQLISYGSCQFPTLGFVVERYKQVQAFIPEPFWKLRITHKKEDIVTEFSWKRGRLFDFTACLVLYQLCLEEPTAQVMDIKSRNKNKWRPQPLDTVEFEKLASRKLRINAKEAMNIAEKLYNKGYISYPRTETTIFAKELNLRSLVEMQREDPNWGGFAVRVLEWGPNPRQGNKTDNAHPPIHPTKYVNNLQGNERSVYELIVRHFLACVSKDAEGKETTIEIEVNSEKFAVNGLMIIARNYLDVYPYDKWNAKIVGEYVLNEVFQPTSIDMDDGQTSAPNLLTEADLIGLMEKHGIGTDATHAEHIETIKSRLYVGLNEQSRFVPGELGMGLVEGYDMMGLFLSKPNLRAELEADLKRIVEGTREPNAVLQEQIRKYKEYFLEVCQQAAKLDQALSIYFNAAAGTVVQDEVIAPQAVNIMKCPRCNTGDIVLRSKRENRGLYLACMSFPNCNAVMWLPESLEEVTVTDEICSDCRPREVKKVKLKFKPGSLRPFYPDQFTACLGGCDSDLLETMGVSSLSSARRQPPITTSTSSRTTNSDSAYESGNNTSSYSNTNPSASSRLLSAPRSQSTSSLTRPTPSSSQQPPRNPFQHFQNDNSSSTHDIVCNCGKTAILLTVRKEGPNTGKQFYKCPEMGDGAKCDFFLWKDDSTSASPTVSHNNPFSGHNSANQNRQHFSGHNGSRHSNFNGHDNGRQSTDSDDIVCNCGKPPILLTVRKEGPNKGRQFYKCPEIGDDEKCNFFQWKDSSDTPSSNSFDNQNSSSHNVFQPHTASNGDSNSETTRCRCSIEARLLTVRKDGENKGRQFHACSRPPGQGGCGFFQWADTDANSSHTNSFSSQSRTTFSSYNNGAGPSNQTASSGKRKCGICSQQGHNKRNCPQK